MAQSRGDVTLTIDGETYTLAPTFKALSAIEAALDMGIGQIAAQLDQLRVGTIAAVLFQAIRANGFTIDFTKVGEEVVATLKEKDRPLAKAATDFLLSYFPEVQVAEGKKPTKAKTPAAG